MVGIIQEQHPDRARLFMQWKDMEWPILVDSYDRLGVAAVPITLAIDEHGVIRQVNPPRGDVERLTETFLSQSYDPPETRPETGPGAPDPDAGRQEGDPASFEVLLAYADAIAVWGGEERRDHAIEAFKEAALADPASAMAEFRLGVAYRMRYDSGLRVDGDFANAVDHWARALEIDPNQYIFRRRIQQYGPRLDKPYSFYDWVNTARAELEAKGEVPAPLTVEPRGAEFAQPSREFMVSTSAEGEPDPRGRVLRDAQEFVEIEVIAVPPAIEPGDAARFHIVFRPIAERRSHWNNEAEELGFWIKPPEGWQVEQHYLTSPLPSVPVSEETRTLEVEIRAPENAEAGTTTIPAYALYYVCEDVDGLCMYRRQDVELPVVVVQY